MPLYEYQCKQCSHLFERIQKFSDPPLTVCPKCGGEIEQLISPPAIHFKGAGWYVTDYANKSGSSSSNGKSSESKSEMKAESKPESKSEAKSDSKSESKPSTSTSSEKK